jgi:pullulanase/glycogen debranching enzyme
MVDSSSDSKKEIPTPATQHSLSATEFGTRVWPGSPHPLGATWDGKGVNVAIFSENAERVELCLFDEKGERETARIALPEYTNQKWHGYFPDLRPDNSTAFASTVLTIPKAATTAMQHNNAALHKINAMLG